jgi:hypothetical protein
MPTGVYSDGSMQFGTQSVSINSVAYILKNIKVQRSRRRLVQNNVFGVPAQKLHIKGLTEGSATAQLASSTTVAPAQDQVFTLTNVGGTGNPSYVTENVGDTYEIEGETMCDITFSEKLT